jgi:phage anti-repressor protein
MSDRRIPEFTGEAYRSTELAIAEGVQKAILSDTEFCVDFDKAWQWVGYSNKANALRGLAGFSLGEDFSSTKRKSTGGRPSEEIMMTADCFKEFCMMAGTSKGKEVRKYFIAAEKRLRAIVDEKRISKQVRKSLTDTIQDAVAVGSIAMHGHEYSTFTDLIYSVVVGMTARQYRVKFGLGKGANVREHLTADQVARIGQYEKIVNGMIGACWTYQDIKSALAPRAVTKVAS